MRVKEGTQDKEKEIGTRREEVKGLPSLPLVPAGYKHLEVRLKGDV